MNRMAYYSAYKNGIAAKKFQSSIPLEKCASENRIMTDAEFVDFMEKNSFDWQASLGQGWNALKSGYQNMSPEAKRLLHAGVGAAGVGLLSGGASKMMGGRFWPAAMVGAGLGGLGGWYYGNQMVPKGWQMPNNTNPADPKYQEAMKNMTTTGVTSAAPTPAPAAPNPTNTLTPENTQGMSALDGFYGTPKNESERPLTWADMVKTSGMETANPAVSKAKVMAQQAQIDAQVAQQNADAQMQKAQLQETHDAEMEKIKAEKERQRQVEMKQKQMMEGIKQHMQVQQQQQAQAGQMPGQPAQAAMQPGMPQRPGMPAGPATPGAAPALPPMK